MPYDGRREGGIPDAVTPPAYRGPVATVAEGLNPAQQEVIDALGAPPSERPVFDAGLRLELRAELEAGLTLVVETLDATAGPLTITKHLLAAVHGCEVRFLEEDRAGFEWSVPLARGSVAHKAIE